MFSSMGSDSEGHGGMRYVYRLCSRPPYVSLSLLREFLMYLQRYKSFFVALPEMLCEGENVVDDSTCWSGDDVVER